MTKNYFQIDKKYVVKGWGIHGPIVYAEAKGCIIKDSEGKEYLDCVAGGAGPSLVGYANPHIVEAVKRTAELTLGMSASYINIPRAELAEKLSKILPPKLNKMHFAQSGTDATETALQGVMLITGKKEIIGLDRGFVGSSIATMCVGSHHGPTKDYPIPIVPGFWRIPAPYCYRCAFGKSYPECDFECARFLETTIERRAYGNVGAFVFESVLGNGGHISPPSKEYFKIIGEICKKYDVLTIADEIQTGFGRTGKMWACELFDFQPDIMTLGKALGGGIPISATIFREDLITPKLQEEEWWRGMSISGAPIQCAAASAVIDVVVNENFPMKATKMGKFMYERLKEMQEKHELIGDVRGPGLFKGVELVKNKKTKEKATDESLSVLKMSHQKGVIFGLSERAGRGNVIKIKPPIIITKDQITKALDVLDSVLSNLEGQI